MSKNNHPHFEAYVSIDLPNPINSLIYEIRDDLSDKKMVVMPVDVPLFGHFDTTMCLMRHKDHLETLMQRVLKDFHKEGLKPEMYPLKTKGFKVTNQGLLVLEFHENIIVKWLLERIVQAGKEMQITCLQEVVRQFEAQPVLYVMLKSHVSEDQVQTYEKTKLEMEIPIERLTFYHKEAVPLTRIQSWDLVEG